MWMKEVFGTDKPVIGMMHLMAMPTDPKWDAEGGLAKVLERARHDLHALQDGGIDGILFCNEFSIPYVANARDVTVACMARIIGELKREITVPYGVNIAGCPYKAFDLAAATDAQFIRGTYFGAYAGDDGIMQYDMGEMMRHRHELGLDKLHLLATVVPEGVKQIAERPLEEIIKSVEFAFNPDTMLVFGLVPGSSVDTSLITRAKAVTKTPVFASNGVRVDTVAKILELADGCVVGTHLKYDSNFFNAVDPDRVKALMKAAKEFRGDI